jgi:hypothetical protein
MVGVLSSTPTAPGIFCGVICGVAFNLGLWVYLPDVFWMWWNFTAVIVAAVVMTVISRFWGRVDPAAIRNYTLAGSGFLRERRLWRSAYTLLILHFFLLLGLLLFLSHFAENLISAL